MLPSLTSPNIVQLQPFGVKHYLAHTAHAKTTQTANTLTCATLFASIDTACEMRHNKLK